MDSVIPMKFTCLSEGKGYHSPPCHILSVCGFRVLIDCPLDLSALTVFSPIPIELRTKLAHEEYTSDGLESPVRKKRKVDKPLDANDLICAEPYYKAVKNLQLWNLSFIDVVLISSPMGMLGLPFLTRNKDFSAKIYVTEAAARLGQLMMEDLITMHKELRQFYGPEVSSFPQWMKWEELELLPSELKEIVSGKDGTEIAGWMPLYSAADVKDCIQKVESLKYAEEVCYNGTLLIKGFSSGLEIGTCNWSIVSPRGNIAYLSNSVFASATAAEFDLNALRGNDVFLYSDFTPLNNMEDAMDDNSSSSLVAENITSCSDDNNAQETIFSPLLNIDEYAEEADKLSFLCSCSLDSVKAGGSVLISVGRPGIMFQLLELIAVSLESSNVMVPIFTVSSIAEELLAFSNIIPEWLSKQRQDRLYAGQPLFDHVKLLKEKRLHVFPAINSRALLTMWQEPCIVFCPHWSLRLGPAVHFLRRWRGDPNSLLVMEEGADANLSLLPFKPMAIKVVQCSFLSGISLQRVQPLMKILQPKHVLFPEKMRHIVCNMNQSPSLGYYSENQTVRIPNLKSISELNIAVELASMLHCTKLRKNDINVARLKGELLMEKGQHHLVLRNEQVTSSQTRPLLHFGRVDTNLLLTEFEKMGINATIEHTTGEDNSSILHIFEPEKASIEVTEKQTLVSTADENLSSSISEAICSIMDII